MLEIHILYCMRRENRFENLRQDFKILQLFKYNGEYGCDGRPWNTMKCGVMHVMTDL